MSASDLLLEKINAAVKAANEAKAQSDSRAKAVGALLLDLKKLHPAVKDFKAALEKIEGLRSLSWAYDCMKPSHMKTTRRSSANGRPRVEPMSKPEPEFRDVTEKSAATKSD